MGHKGVSKRKPKKSKLGSNDNINHGSNKVRPGESLLPMQALVNAQGAPLDKGGGNLSAGSNKKKRKGK